MSVLITGGAGFIGYYTKELLKHEGYEVIILDDFSSGTEKNISSSDEVIRGDARNPAIYEQLKGKGINKIIHLAAQISVPQSVKDPISDLQRNTESTLNMLSIAKELGVDTFVFSSTAAVYGDTEALPITENHQLNPMAPYGVSKMSSEYYIRNFCEAEGMNYFIFRYANVYGPKYIKDGEGNVLNSFIERIKKDEPLHIYGDGNQTRDFIYVRDVARAHLLALNSANSGIYNVSTNSEITLLQLINQMELVLKRKLELEFYGPREGDIFRSCLDNGKVMEGLGWSPKSTLIEGLEETFKHLNV